MVAIPVAFFAVILISLFAIGVMIAIVVGFSLAEQSRQWLNRRVSQFASIQTRRTSGHSTIWSIIQTLFAPTGVTVVFISLSGAMNQEFLRAQNTDRVNSLITNAQSMIKEADQAALPVTDVLPNRPQWIDDGNVTLGDIKKVVLSSRLWSTEAEAKNELKSQLAEMIQADFEQRHNGLFDARGYRYITDEQIASVSVKERYIERIDQDFGKFLAPMNRLWWQVEISPMVRTELYPAWKSATTKNRVIVVGTLLAMLTLAANVFGEFSKTNGLPNRRSFRRITSYALCMGLWVAVESLLTLRLLVH